jgi:MFS family permease
LSFVGIILAYTLYNVSYALLSYPAGVISDGVPRRLVFATGLGIFAAAYIGLGAVTSSGWVWLLLPLYGGYTALTDGVGKAWVTDLLPEERVGTGLGLYQGLAGGAALIAGIWAGLAWGSDGRLPLLVSGVAVAGLAAVLFLGGTRLERGGTEKAADGGSIGTAP